MPNDGVLYQIRQRIDYERLFSEFCQMTGRGTWRTALCVFHENTDTGSLRLNVDEGFYRCMNPECGAHGDFIDFYMRVRDLTFPEAVEELARRVGVSVERDASRAENGVIDEAIVESAHARLLATRDKIRWLEERRGFNIETIRRYQIGHDGQRYYIPIRDEIGRVVNIRRYLPGASGADKMISWRTGYGSARLWPFDSIADLARPVLLLEGEMDCLLALQNGFNAMTATGGAGTWRDAWTPMFRGRDVLVCYDVDEAGRAGAAQVATKLYGQARTIKLINLPISEPAGADFTDYIHGHGHTADDFRALAESTTAYQATSTSENGPDAMEPIDRSALAIEPENIHLSRASLAEYHNAPIRVNVVVSGKMHAPFIVPHTCKMSCSMPALPMCQRCPVAELAGSIQRTLEFDSNEILQFINTPDDQVEKRLKRKMGVPGKCSYVQIEHVQSQNVEELQIIPELDRTDDQGKYVTRAAYYVGHGLEPNRSYLMTGHTVTEPKRQLATHLIHTAVPSQSNIDAFRLTEDVRRDLEQFRPEGSTTADLWAKVDAIYEDLEKHVRIYQRRDLLLAMDLVFHSMIHFRLQGDMLKRGWCEALVIGDSRTGKSTVMERIIDYYRAGEISSGENTTLAGLVGGLHQLSNASWALKWGRIPLNDRRLLGIDEAGSLPTEHIERMSGIRSSGEVEIVKVHHERTLARTRMIWVSNPRGNLPLSSYSQGVLAVKELIGKPEDIARFDLVVTAASGDVGIGVVNATRAQGGPETYTRALCHARVMFAWSRTPDQVTFTPEAEQRVLVRATQQGEKYRYATAIPLVEPNEQRVKLARLAAAAACMFYSTDASGETIVVKPEHVEFIYEFLERLYSKPSLAFAEFAEIQRREYEIQNTGDVRRIIERSPGCEIEFMQEEVFSQSAIGQILDIEDRDELSRVTKKLVRYGFLKRRSARGFFIKTPAAIRFLREILSSNGVQASMNGALSNGHGHDDDTPPW